MKISYRRSQLKSSKQGYAALAMVMAIGITALFSLIFVFRQGMQSHTAQVGNQVKIDYRQKEDALLRALVAIVPNKAVGAMMGSSASNDDAYSWQTIFNEAIIASNAETALSAELINSIGIPNIIVANSGDTSLNSASQIVSVVAGDGTLIGPGNTANTGLLSDPLVMSKLPAALDFNGPYSSDQDFPIISHDKTYPASSPGLGASAAAAGGWNLYNIIDYPDVRFGLVNQGGKFVAKRNWWAFSLTFGANDIENSGIPAIKKNYVLSIYEVPVQSALSASENLRVGTFADGTIWQNTTVDGGVFGGNVMTGGNLSLGLGQISARRSVNLGNGTRVNNGDTVANGFNAMGARETRSAGLAIDSDFYGVSVAADSGRLAILPLGQGAQFLRRDESQGMSNTISPTPWDKYALGSRQCKMQIEIRAMENDTSTVPTRVRFHYQVGGVSTYTDYTAGGNWDNHVQDAGLSVIPFYWEILEENSGGALAINLEKIPAFLVSLGADNETKNNSLSVWANNSLPTVRQPQIPTNSNLDMAVILRNCEDLSAFSKGLSIVTDHRVYFAENFNQVQLPGIPLGSGIPMGADFYPPVSVFAAEKRFGTNFGNAAAVHLEGQLTSLSDDRNTTENPLDLRESATLDRQLSHDKVSAALSQILSPAQLPPVTKMAWLVVVEELHGTNTTVAYDDGNNGHGNDDGGVDPSNPGNGNNGNNGNP